MHAESQYGVRSTGETETRAERDDDSPSYMILALGFKAQKTAGEAEASG